MATVTCRTEGCGNAGEAIDVATSYTDDDGNTVEVGGVVCGVCGQTIDDVR